MHTAVSLIIIYSVGATCAQPLDGTSARAPMLCAASVRLAYRLFGRLSLQLRAQRKLRLHNATVIAFLLLQAAIEVMT
jgi:hypothetical protein